MAQLANQTSLFALNCASCGIEYAIPQDFVDRRRADHAAFYCPAGHSNVYQGLSVAENLRIELAAANRRTEMEANTRRAAERDAKAAKRKLRTLTHRVECGVCPHCQRTFKQLAAHMKAKHGVK